MNLSSILFGFVLSTLYGSLFHLWRGGNIFKLLFYLLLSWLGFWVGQWAAEQTGWTFLTIGQLHLGLASLSCFIFIFIGYWLSLLPKKNEGE